MKRLTFTTALFFLAAQTTFSQTYQATLFKDVATGSGWGQGEWSIGGSGENLEIREPEHGNKLWAQFVDDQRLELLGTPNLHLNGYIRGGGTNGQLRVNTTRGSISIGPREYGWGHIETDQNRFYFNKEIRVDQGLIGSYNENLQLRTSGTTRMTISNSNGNVGIGTTNPLEKLHVNGNLLIPSDKFLKFGTENSNTGHLTIANGSCCYNTYADIKGNLYFRTEASQATLGIQKDATVTVGVWPRYDDTVADTDGHKLMVNGGILCEKVKVIGDVPNYDHVFEKDYDLKSIEEVKEFVEVNKHLPEIPSAKEFEENGYNVGEMDGLLLKKVEELTLYIIQLKEEVDALKADNVELKQAVSK